MAAAVMSFCFLDPVLAITCKWCLRLLVVPGRRPAHGARAREPATGVATAAKHEVAGDGADPGKTPISRSKGIEPSTKGSTIGPAILVPVPEIVFHRAAFDYCHARSPPFQVLEERDDRAFRWRSSENFPS